MSKYKIRPIEYFFTSIHDEGGEAHELLSHLAEQGINLLGFSAMPVGPERTQLYLFPDEAAKLQQVAKDAGLPLEGPHGALLVQGDDELGALAKIHGRLQEGNVNVVASSGLADGHGSFTYIIYVSPDQYQAALSALETFE